MKIRLLLVGRTDRGAVGDSVAAYVKRIERLTAFEQVVVTACQGAVMEGQVHALIEDLSDLMQEDGIDKRVEMVAKSISKVDHQQEVLRVASLLAQVSGGVSDEERELLGKLQKAFGLDESALTRALAEAASTVGK